jgi:hypothetical protein
MAPEAPKGGGQSAAADTKAHEYLWHSAFHRTVGVERLYFWLISCQERFDRQTIIPTLTKIFEAQGIHSFVIWELFGEQDILVRTWLTPNIDIDKVERELSTDGRRVRGYSVPAVLRHWMWDEIEAKTDELFGSVTVEELADINDPSVNQATLKDYLTRGFVRVIDSPIHTLKFFVFIRRPQDFNAEQERAFRAEILKIAEDSSHLQYWSLFRVRGPGESRYILTGRVSPDNFEAITSELNASINSVTGGIVVGAKTTTYLATSSRPRYRQERIVPFGLKELSIAESRRSTSRQSH